MGLSKHLDLLDLLEIVRGGKRLAVLELFVPVSVVDEVLSIHLAPYDFPEVPQLGGSGVVMDYWFKPLGESAVEWLGKLEALRISLVSGGAVEVDELEETTLEKGRNGGEDIKKTLEDLTRWSTGKLLTLCFVEENSGLVKGDAIVLVFLSEKVQVEQVSLNLSLAERRIELGVGKLLEK